MPEQKIESLPNFWDCERPGAQQDQMKVFGSAPLWLRESLIFPTWAGRIRALVLTMSTREAALWRPHPISTEQISTPRATWPGPPDALALESSTADTVRYEDGLGEFEIRLLLQQHLGDDSAAALAAAGGRRPYRCSGIKGRRMRWCVHVGGMTKRPPHALPTRCSVPGETPFGRLDGQAMEVKPLW